MSQKYDITLKRLTDEFTEDYVRFALGVESFSMERIDVESVDKELPSLVREVDFAAKVSVEEERMKSDKPDEEVMKEAQMMLVDINIFEDVIRRRKGAVSRDTKVDAADLAAMATAFSFRPGWPNWNPAADLNRDSIVDIFDLVQVGRNFARH